jgi:methionine-rich copper-binding protein CopC
MKFATLLFFLLLTVAGVSSEVWGHSFPDHSEPRVGNEVNGSPAEVRIFFDVAVEPLFSTIEVFDSNHRKVDKNDSHVDPNDHTILAVSLLPLLSPGPYEVHWSVISIDTHHTEGTYKFKIR